MALTFRWAWAIPAPATGGPNEVNEALRFNSALKTQNYRRLMGA